MLDANKLSQELSTRSIARAEKSSAFKALEDSEKSILATITESHLMQGSKSVAAAELKARSSAEYKDFLERKGAARLESDLAIGAHEVYRIHIELLRSNLSYEKAQMGLV